MLCQDYYSRLEKSRTKPAEKIGAELLIAQVPIKEDRLKTFENWSIKSKMNALKSLVNTTMLEFMVKIIILGWKKSHMLLQVTLIASFSNEDISQ